MKILALHLRAFGPFSDFELDLSAGSHGLHLIYGPNEAGKSTTLRALEQMFFGIPANSSDDFVHPYARLRIGATLSDGNGTTLSFWRRKGNKNTLLEADDKTPLDEARLGSFLGGLEQRLFATMFGLNHQRLQEGGQAIASGGGRVGTTLFAAASGISHLQTICERLEGEAKSLFTTRHSKAAINTSLSSLKDARKSIRDAQLPSSEWSEHEATLRRANQRLQQVERELQEATGHLGRFQRLQQALPLVAKRRAILQQQAAVGPVPRLPADFAVQRREAVVRLAAAGKAEREAVEALGQLRLQIQSLVVPEQLLAEAETLEDLAKRLSVHRSAQNDCRELRVRQEQQEHDAATLLGRLRPDLGLAAVEQLRLTSQQKVALQNLAIRHGAVVKQLEQARREIEQLTTQTQETEASLAALESPRDARALREAVRRAQSQGDLELQASTARADLERRQRQAAVELKRLPLWSGTLEALETLPVPGAETVDHFEARLAEVEQEIALADRERAEVEQRLAECRRQWQEWQLQGEVPLESDLLAARRRRELGWQLVLDAWRHGVPEAARLAEFLEASAESDLAAAYAEAVQEADELSDRLRREADRVAKRAALQAQQTQLDQRLAEVERKLQEGKCRRQRAWQAWVECWKPLGCEPRWPREMRAWLDRHRTLLAQAEAIRTAQQELECLEQRIAAQQQELQTRLAELGEAAVAGHSLAARIGQCQALVDHLTAVAERRQRCESEHGRLEREASVAQKTAEQAESRLAEWHGQWAAGLKPLGLPPETPLEVVQEFLARLDDLFERVEKARDLAQRIAEIERYAVRFQEDCAAITRRVAPDLAELSPEEQAEELVRRLRRASEDRQKQDMLRQQCARQETVREEARYTVEQMTAQLQAMCQEARCTDTEQLPAAIQASEAAAALCEQLQAVEEPLMHLCGGGTLEAMVAETEAIDADRLPLECGMLQEQIDRLAKERDELCESRGREQKTLETLDLSQAAADAGEEMQGLLARLESDARHYARLRIASAVLREGIERYRKKNENPVLRRASELFGQLTGGSFAELRAEVDSRGENVLVGVRGDGSEPVPLAGMSDGTCDQLYLALRLASLEHYLTENAPVPLILDDILVSFDDRRATAALAVLGELSRATQVLFFTHHEHLVELAEGCLPPEQLVVHRLGSGTRV